MPPDYAEVLTAATTRSLHLARLLGIIRASA